MQEQVDWESVERSSEFRELVAAKRRFVLPRVVFFLSWYIGFVLLAGYAEDFMNERIHEGLTVGYLLALSQFVMVWFLVWEYLRKANSTFDPLEEAVQAKFADLSKLAGEQTGATGRFQREPRPTEAPDVVQARGGTQ
jgi:uncharacterized membrane protein (DUF485 family)